MEAAQVASPALTERRPPLLRTAAVGFALLFVGIGLLALSWNARENFLSDYLSFWAAGHFVLGGKAPLAYDLWQHRALQESLVGPLDGNMPFPYPPPFLFAVTPFSLAPYVPAFALWVAVTAILYWRVAKSYAPTPFVMSQPAVLMTYLLGQSSFVVAAILLAGLRRLSERPFVGGLILGLMVIKPQLALLLPVAVLAGRRWAAIPGALLSAGVALLAAWVVFGTATYRGFLQLMPVYTGWLRGNGWPWDEFATPYAFVRYFGGSLAAGMAVQLAFAAFAVGVTALAWAQDWREKVPVLAAATLLVSPYLLTYDSLLLLVPAAWWIGQGRRTSLILIVWLGCWLPIGHFLAMYSGPNTIPLAVLVALGGLLHDRWMRVAD
ncbi:DUF2029 domain-containing protein [Sphingomonas sp. BN140010]|uniref:DUF2029 domain-containing protein n=1 Tax=Sphingomonas arvum TaxID=2992113 RepID=A0ABT3JEH8_9SPHN|nr:glycosyltransferase family 87 protein [Sphingomonas sp. BN140010]MCW3797170.1 DUF2029 domain-containing protein [Sphingomonas sp. BN140010]